MIWLNYFPAIVISFINTDGEPQRVAPKENGLNFKSSPILTISFNTLKKLPDTVMLFTGAPFLPSTISNPLAAKEKSPVIAFASLTPYYPKMTPLVTASNIFLQ